jgi:hypothetical protein
MCPAAPRDIPFQGEPFSMRGTPASMGDRCVRLAGGGEEGVADWASNTNKLVLCRGTH